jgi:hypothetical protein
MEEEEEMKCSELGTELEPGPAGRYLLMEERPATVDAWAQRMKRCRFYHMQPLKLPHLLQGAKYLLLYIYILLSNVHGCNRRVIDGKSSYQ